VSQKLVDRSPSLKRLRDEGYDLRMLGNHVAVGSVPYVNANREIQRGVILSTLELAQNQVKKPDDHTVWFAGGVPCDKNGASLNKIVIDTTVHTPVNDLTVHCRFSSKPTDGNGYPDYYAKLTTYIRILTHEAQAIDSSVTASVFPVVPSDNVDTPFKYFDTASSRAGIDAIATKIALPRIAIVGLGGTGSYVLDLVAKTSVREIHLFDDDEFSQHSAFRCPGAVGLEELISGLKKVDRYATIYSKLHAGVIAHAYRITPANVQELLAMQFVFLCLDGGELKDTIMGELERADIAFVDVGMGIIREEGRLGGILRVTSSTARKRDHIRSKNRISFAPAVGKNEYSTNIQVAELNALNAALAVLKWKKMFGFYHDLKQEHHTTFVVETNKLGNEDFP